MKHMSKDTLNRTIAPILLSLFVGLGTFLSLWPNNFTGLEVSTNLAHQLMLLFLSGGMVFFLMSRNRLMVICFVGCALICYDLNERDSAPFKPALTQDNAFIRVGIYNLYANYQKLDESLDMMCNSNTDFISIKAIPNHQFLAVKDHLNQCGYYFQHYSDQEHPTSVQALFSKTTLPERDTIYLTLLSNKDSLSELAGNKRLTLRQIFKAEKLNSLDSTSILGQQGVIQTYKLIQQEPANHVKKTSQKL